MKYRIESDDRRYAAGANTIKEAKSIIEHKAIETGSTFLIMQGGNVHAAYRWDERNSKLMKVNW